MFINDKRELCLSGNDIKAIESGESISIPSYGQFTSIRKAPEDPLEYIERSWAEPQFGETPQQHFNRINGVHQ